MRNPSFRRKTAFALALIMALSMAAVYTAAAETATVTGGWLILRATPSFDAKNLATYPTGTVVTITGKSGSWYAVTAPDGMNGWMYSSFLRLDGGSSGGGTGTAKITSKNGLNVRLRAGAGTGYAALGSYAPGTSVTILSSGSEWTKVQIGTLTGYIMTKYLTGGNSSGSASLEFKPTCRCPASTRSGLPAITARASISGKGLPRDITPSDSTASERKRPWRPWGTPGAISGSGTNTAI